MKVQSFEVRKEISVHLGPLKWEPGFGEEIGVGSAVESGIDGAAAVEVGLPVQEHVGGGNLWAESDEGKPEPGGRRGFFFWMNGWVI